MPETNTLVLPIREGGKWNTATVRKYYSRVRETGCVYIREGGRWRRAVGPMGKHRIIIQLSWPLILNVGLHALRRHHV